MRVLVAGATGAIGAPLVTRLRAEGHEVVGTSRRPGAADVALDAFDLDAVRRVVAEARPDVVVHQLTALPREPSPRGMGEALATTNRLRTETVPTFAVAAREAGARRVVVQSIAFVTRPDGPAVQDEDAPLWLDAPADFRPVIESVHRMERDVHAIEGIESVVLRYGFFYGPGTWYAPDGAFGQMIARRRLPIIGDGEGRYSMVHVDDAVDATVRALDRGAPGTYNVVDDEPVPARVLLPEIARLMGARPPRRLPAWLARPVAGSAAVHYGTTLRGASNARARADLGIQPRPWREGLTEVFAPPAPHG